MRKKSTVGGDADASIPEDASTIPVVTAVTSHNTENAENSHIHFEMGNARGNRRGEIHTGAFTEGRAYGYAPASIALPVNLDLPSDLPIQPRGREIVHRTDAMQASEIRPRDPNERTGVATLSRAGNSSQAQNGRFGVDTPRRSIDSAPDNRSDLTIGDRQSLVNARSPMGQST